MTWQPEDLRVEDFLRVVYIGGEVKYLQIAGIDDIVLRKEFSEISAGESLDFTEVSELDPPTNELHWIYRIETEYNVKIYLKQPAAVNRLGTTKSPEAGVLVNEGVSPLAGRRLNLWIATDYPPNIKIENGTNVAVSPVVWFIGKRYAVNEVKEVPKVFYTVKIGGIT